jgi:hypothetical protein
VTASNSLSKAELGIVSFEESTEDCRSLSYQSPGFCRKRSQCQTTSVTSKLYKKGEVRGKRLPNCCFLDRLKSYIHGYVEWIAVSIYVPIWLSQKALEIL